MSKKCVKCKKKIETTFLDKVKGTPIKKKGKITWMCSECQKKQAKV